MDPTKGKLNKIVIVDLEKFIKQEQPYWDELEGLLALRTKDAAHESDLAESRRFYYLYRRATSGLARIQPFAAEISLTAKLDSLVSRAYPYVHGGRKEKTRFRPLHWFCVGFPCAFRRQFTAFIFISVTITLGSLLGAVAVQYDDESKSTIMPFAHLMGNPADRVALEEATDLEDQMGQHNTFAASLMVNNIRVSIFNLALGITYGLGTLLITFYNGVILGGVMLDYIRAGESVFLAAWLLPHGSVEIPAILFAGQAGLIIGQCLLGWRSALSIRERFRACAQDITMLIYGVAILLVWAGIIESFLSQYHGPNLYPWKIAFGTIQLAVLFAFLLFAGRNQEREDAHA